MKKSRCLFWDIGGVIVKIDNHVLAEALAKYSWYYSPFEIEKALNNWDSNPVLKKYCNGVDKGVVSVYEFYRKISRFFYLRCTLGEFKAAWKKELKKNEDIIALIRSLKGRVVQGVISNLSPIHEELVFQFAPKKLFDGPIIVSYRINKIKPEPEIFQEALKQASIHPRDVLFVDDRADNCRAAQNLGIQTFQFRGDLAPLLACIKEFVPLV